MSIRIFNRQNNATVHAAEIIVHGSSSHSSGIIQVSATNTDNGATFPPQFFEVNGSFFKALVHLEPGSNEIVFKHRSGIFQHGRPVIDQVPQFEELETTLNLNYEPLTLNPPVHLCLLVGRNSQYSFDSPNYRIRAESNDVHTAVKKVRFAAKLISAYLEEQFARAGLGNRTLRFAEQEQNDTISAKQAPQEAYRRTVKVHIVSLEQSVEEIRETGDTDTLTEWATEGLKNYGNPFFPGTFTKAVCFYLDAHWSVCEQRILAHAPGYRIADDGSSEIYVTGAHAIWTYPQNYEDLYAAFSEIFPVDTNQVANEFGLSSTPWEAANVAFGSLIVSLFGLFEPALRDLSSEEKEKYYYYFSRSFMTKEYYCARTSEPGFAPVLARDEFDISREVLVQSLFEKEFRLQLDYQDESLPQDELPKYVAAAKYYAIRGDRILFTSDYGIKLVEIVINNDNDDDNDDEGVNTTTIGSIEFLPASASRNGKSTIVKEVAFTYPQLQQYIHNSQYADLSISLKVHAIGAQKATYIRNPEQLIQDHHPGNADLVGLYGHPDGQTPFYHTPVHGGDGGHETPTVYFNYRQVYSARVYHDADTVQGFKLFMADTSTGTSISMLFAEEGDAYSDFRFNEGEYLQKMNLRCGLWLDAIQFVTSEGRKSKYFGNAYGGRYEEIAAPPGYQIIGFRGRNGAWIDALGGIYGRLS